MKTSIKMSLLLAATGLAATSCGPDWGKMDPPAGNQIYPTLQNVGCYTFDEENVLDDTFTYILGTYANDALPEVVNNTRVLSPVLKVTKDSYLQMENMLPTVVCQKAAGLSFGIYLSEDTPNSASILHWEDETGAQVLDLKANGELKYNDTRSEEGTEEGEEEEETTLGTLSRDEWHFWGVDVHNDGYALYIDGIEYTDLTVNDVDLTDAVQLMATTPYVYVNYGSAEHADMLLDDITFYRNQITAKEAKMPKKFLPPSEDGFPQPVFFYNFENGTGDAKIVGGGEIVDAGGVFGKVFQNASGGMRENYLQLPNDVFVKTGDKNEFTISVWLNAKNASDYGWSPLFTAYDDNVKGSGCPEFACQYRGQVQVNCNGNDNSGDAWCDYGDNLCDQGKVTWKHWETDWLADKGWHHYAATFTKTSAAVYFDGELINSWTLDGVSRGQRCEFFGDSRFNFFALGGMQAWGWGDPDPGFMFDDLALYDRALDQDQVNEIIGEKIPVPYYKFDFENGLGGASIEGGGEIVDEGGAFGKVFQNASGGMRENYLKLPSDIFTKLAGKEAFSISVFLNARNASDYGWCPLFTAYDHNVAGSGCPMFACQYRGSVQVNCNGNDNDGDAWCDYGNELCDQGAVTVKHWETDWLADKEWHHYAAVFTKTTAAVYFDGELLNSWTIDGESRGQRCEFFGDERFDLFCLGGMQAWNWGDPDPGFMFDDLELYDKVLSPEMIKDKAASKK